MTAPFITPPIFRLFDNAGLPAAGALVYTYASGTTTPKTTYSDVAGTVPNTNPVVLDTTGSAIIRAAPGAYNLVAKDATGITTILSADQYSFPVYSQADIAALLYPQTIAETAASITPANYIYPPGDLRRYGADPTGVADSHPALLSACACNALVFDGYPGGGTYLLNSETAPANYPLTIQGQAKGGVGASGNTGTIFLLATAAGAGAAALRWVSFVDGLRIKDIGFKFQSAAGQYGIHVGSISSSAGQLRLSIIDGCAFIGTGASDNNVGIRIDSGTGGAQYSAFNSFRECYFTGLSEGIVFTGNGTPNQVIACNFIGYSGAAGAISGQGIQINYPATEIKIMGCYFEGWTNGIFSSGGALIQQSNNDFQACTNGYNWVQTTRAFIANQSFGDTGVAGITSGTSNTDASQMQTAGPGGWLATGGAIGSTRGFQEGTGAGSNLRAANVGYGTTAAIVMAANNGGTISAQSTTTWSFSYVGGTLYLSFQVSATLTGAGTTALTLPLPGGTFPIVNVQNPCSVTNNGATAFGVCYATTSAANLNIGLGATGSGAFTAGTVGATGQIAIRILS